MVHRLALTIATTKANMSESDNDILTYQTFHEFIESRFTMTPISPPQPPPPAPDVDTTHFTAPVPTPTEMAHLDRQQALNLHLPTRGVAVIGCGGVGSWIALYLALAGVTNLWLFDFDTISESNLNRFPLGPDAVGQKKSEALAKAITLLRPTAKPVPMGRFTPELATSIALHHEVNWVVCSTDSLSSRQSAHAWARDVGARYIEAAAEGEYGSVTGAPAEFATPEENLPGYASVPVWVGPCVVAASMAVAHIIHNRRLGDRVIRIGWNGDITDYMDSNTPAKATKALTIAQIAAGEEAA